MFAAAAAAADRPSGDDTHWRGRDREQGREGHLVAAQFTAEGSERSLPIPQLTLSDTHAHSLSSSIDGESDFRCLEEEKVRTAAKSIFDCFIFGAFNVV